MSLQVPDLLLFTTATPKQNISPSSNNLVNHLLQITPKTHGNPNFLLVIASSQLDSLAACLPERDPLMSPHMLRFPACILRGSPESVPLLHGCSLIEILIKKSSNSILSNYDGCLFSFSSFFFFGL
ncbi:hypothetical protein CEXT_100681 [Caerostris extrusa]|uniref:Uncharacterized protein n=1 Tax=Caerostris extrusa TaxID=172846 RepID=A0AAV4W5N0_CAEEX|nr:hypothetical protein CEXT_100681 [Caerostris extrusa]